MIQQKKNKFIEKDAHETQKTTEGSARRNIVRKNTRDPQKKDRKQNGGGGGKGKWNYRNDGSMDY